MCNTTNCRCGGNAAGDTLARKSCCESPVPQPGSVVQRPHCQCPCHPPEPMAPQLAFYKIDMYGNYLPGAVFALEFNNTAIATATSNAFGLVNFGIIWPGTYSLREIQPPAGMGLTGIVYTVHVDACGYITIDGRPVDSFVVINLPPVPPRPSAG